MSFNINPSASVAGPNLNRPTSARTASTTAPDPYVAELSTSDRELVFQATGRRVDENSAIVPMFAVEIALDRKSGQLQPGEEISATYLNQMAAKYSGDEYKPSFGVAIGRALDYLAGNSAGTSLNILA